MSPSNGNLHSVFPLFSKGNENRSTAWSVKTNAAARTRRRDRKVTRGKKNRGFGKRELQAQEGSRIQSATNWQPRLPVNAFGDAPGLQQAACPQATPQTRSQEWASRSPASRSDPHRSDSRAQTDRMSELSKPCGCAVRQAHADCGRHSAGPPYGDRACRLRISLLPVWEESIGSGNRCSAEGNHGFAPDVCFPPSCTMPWE